MARINVLLENKFILYGMGVSNKSVKNFFDKHNIDYIIVEEDYEVTNDYIVIKSPGISNDTVFLNRCKKFGIKVINDIELYFLLNREVKYIGITGTCGKTTTATLLYNIMKDKYKVLICGNIGIPIFDTYDKDFEYLIVELSSYQLEYINEFKPKYFIILNIFHHHLNHHKTYKNYFHCKCKPILNMSENDYLIINKTCTSYLEGWKIKCKTFTFSNDLRADVNIIDNIISFKQHRFDCSNIKYFNYEFNKLNFLSIFVLIQLLNINNYVSIIKAFDNLEHRMELIINNKDLIVINDSKSTCLSALIEAYKYCIKNYTDHKLIIIMGGKLDLDEFNNYINDLKLLKCADVYCYGENKDLIFNFINCKVYLTLEQVIENLKLDYPCVILFSPGAQSLAQFSSYIQRGEVFKKLVINKFK